MQKCHWKSAFAEKQQNKVNSLKKQKHENVIHNSSDNFVG